MPRYHAPSHEVRLVRRGPAAPAVSSGFRLTTFSATSAATTTMSRETSTTATSVARLQEPVAPGPWPATVRSWAATGATLPVAHGASGCAGGAGAVAPSYSPPGIGGPCRVPPMDAVPPRTGVAATRPRLRLAAFAAVMFVAIFGVGEFSRWVLAESWWAIDLDLVLDAGARLVAGQPLYADPRFLYPPLAAVLAVPLLAVDPFLVSLAYLGFKVGLALVAVGVMA